MALDLPTLIGFLGVAMVLAAYFANQQRWLSSEDWRFPAINLVGSCCILISLYAAWNLPSFIINASWVAISFWGLVKGWRRSAAN